MEKYAYDAPHSRKNGAYVMSFFLYALDGKKTREIDAQNVRNGVYEDKKFLYTPQ